jgi:hypothetical protein
MALNLKFKGEKSPVQFGADNLAIHWKISRWKEGANMKLKGKGYGMKYEMRKF